MAGNGFPLDDVSGDLSPLPTVHRQGLVGIAVLAALSFVSCSAVLLYLTVKFARWCLGNWKQARSATADPNSPPGVDLALGLDERHFVGDNAKHGRRHRRKRAHPNQFLILIYNLLLADIHQAASFLLNAVWVGKDGIEVRTSICWAQAWLVQIGDVASSLFITAIAVHTYLAIVRNYTPPQWAVYTSVVSLWVFNYLLMVLGIAITDNGKDVGGFFVRATAWCWINVHYENLRLYLHYLWIFIALVITLVLYILIWLSLRKRPAPSPPQLPAAADSRTNIHDGDGNTDGNIDEITNTPSESSIRKPQPAANTSTNDHHAPPQHQGGHNKAFLLYPLIYIICTAPLALGRIATMAGVVVPISYFCTAGALITSNGWLDVLLWGVTRHRLLFSADVDTEESGLETFNFMRTPQGRRWGNMVWVEGGGRGHGGGDGGEESGMVGGLGKRRMGWRPLGFGGAWGSGGAAGVAAGQDERGRGAAEGQMEDGLAIQMDMVTTVVVEPAGLEQKEGWDRERRRHAANSSQGSNVREPAYDADMGLDDTLIKDMR